MKIRDINEMASKEEKRLIKKYNLDKSTIIDFLDEYEADPLYQSDKNNLLNGNVPSFFIGGYVFLDVDKRTHILSHHELTTKIIENPRYNKSVLCVNYEDNNDEKFKHKVAWFTISEEEKMRYEALKNIGII